MILGNFKTNIVKFIFHKIVLFAICSVHYLCSLISLKFHDVYHCSISEMFIIQKSLVLNTNSATVVILIFAPIYLLLVLTTSKNIKLFALLFLLVSLLFIIPFIYFPPDSNMM